MACAGCRGMRGTMEIFNRRQEAAEVVAQMEPEEVVETMEEAGEASYQEGKFNGLFWGVLIGAGLYIVVRKLF